MGIKSATEKRFMGTVIQFAQLHGWTVYHTLDSRGSQDGFPDLVFRRGTNYTQRVIVAELKTDRGAATVEQVAWLDAFATICDAYLWRPSDWPEIERVLGGTSCVTSSN